MTKTQKNAIIGSMEQNTVLLNQKIAKNLIAYRKRAGLTQAEVAEKINYSDKSVSKWESANGVPDIYILVQLAELYGVTVNDFLGEEPKVPEKPRNHRARFHALIMLLSSGIVWLVATCLFVLLQVSPFEGAWWLVFVYALPVNAIVIVALSGAWKYKLVNFFAVSALVWTALTSLYLTVVSIDVLTWLQTPWLIFVLGVPLQVLETLWAFFRYSIFKKRSKKAGK